MMLDLGKARLVPEIPDMFDTPSWLATCVADCSMFEHQPLRLILQHRASTGKLRRERTRIFFVRIRRRVYVPRRYSTTCHNPSDPM